MRLASKQISNLKQVNIIHRWSLLSGKINPVLRTALNSINYQEILRKSRPTQHTVLGHRAEDPVSMVQDVEFVHCLRILWILGTAPEDDECWDVSFPGQC